MNEIKLNKQDFTLFNADDRLGIFNEKINRIVNGLGRIDPSSTSLFDYDEYIVKLTIQLFLKYEYIAVTEKGCLFGFCNGHRTLIKCHPGVYAEAADFIEIARKSEKNRSTASRQSSMI
jgi:hypothetical protein